MYHRSVRLILASASPRRAELLRSAGFAFDVVPVNVDETPLAGEQPGACVVRLASAKARAVACRNPGTAVIGADTVVVVDGHLLGKPRDDADAANMLRMLSGRTHEVWTGVTICRDGQEASDAVVTRVHFLQMTTDEILWYVGSGEPRDKAGAYGVQGLASRFIDHLEGSYSNVVGLPIATVYRLLNQVGVEDARWSSPRR